MLNMSADDPMELRSFRGSALLNGIVVRITARCLREDFVLPPHTAMDEALEKAETAILATDAPHARSLNLSRSALVRQVAENDLVVYSENGQIRWILAHGPEASTTCVALDLSGRLWPSPQDRAWLEQDMFAMGLRRLQVDAPLALAKARQEKGRACRIPGPTGQITVVVDEITGTTYAAVGAGFLAKMDRQALRRFALVLACLLPDEEWNLCADEIETSVSDEFDQHGPSDPHVIFCNTAS